VRQIADQLAACRLLVHLPLLALPLQLLADRPQLDQQDRTRAIDAREHAGKGKRLAPGALVVHILGRVIPVRGESLGKRLLQLCGFGKQRRKALPQQGACADCEQAFRSRIGVAHGKALVE